MACVRRAVWGMLYADDATIVSRSAEGLAKVMTVIVTVSEAAGLTVSERTAETMCYYKHRAKHPWLHRSSSKQLARGNDRRTSYYYLGGVIHDSAESLVRNRTTDPSHVGMLQTVRPRNV